MPVERAAEACEPVADRWCDAARTGLDDPALRHAAMATVTAARDAFDRLDMGPTTSQACDQYVERYLDQGRTPGDDLLDAWRQGRPLVDLDIAGAAVDLRMRIADELATSRRRSLGLLEPLDHDALHRQHSPLMSPLVWDLAHIGNYEDQWLLRALGEPGVGPQLRRHLRRLPPSPPGPASSAHAEPRRGARPTSPRSGAEPSTAWSGSTSTTARSSPRRLAAAGFVYGMVVQHEHQHDETMLATLQLMAAPGYRPVVTPAAARHRARRRRGPRATPGRS